MVENDESLKAPLYGSEIIKHFCNNEKVFIAVCLYDKKDLDIVCYVVNTNKKQKCLLVPHLIREESLNEIVTRVEGKSLLFSECAPETDFSDIQVLIIDFLGSIPKIYGYCMYAYIGVGITQHRDDITDVTKYGLPFAFRSKRYIKDQHSGITNLKIGTIIKNGKDLDAWLRSLRYDEFTWANIHNTALNYAKENGWTSD